MSAPASAKAGTRSTAGTSASPSLISEIPTWRGPPGDYDPAALESWISQAFAELEVEDLEAELLNRVERHVLQHAVGGDELRALRRAIGMRLGFLEISVDIEILVPEGAVQLREYDLTLEMTRAPDGVMLRERVGLELRGHECVDREYDHVEMLLIICHGARFQVDWIRFADREM